MKLLRNAVLMVAGAFALTACEPVVGSRYVKSEQVSASAGGELTVDAAENATLAGTRLTIPAGALPADQLLTLEIGLEDQVGDELAAGPVAIFGPDTIELSADATLVLPLSGLASTDDLSIVVQSAGVSWEVDSSQVALNAARTFATFHVRRLGSFQARRRAVCNAMCANGLVCVNGRCRGATDGGTTCPMPCPAGTACDPSTLACVAQPLQCASTIDCPTNFACVNGTCQAPSTGSCGPNTCASGQVCHNGMCGPATTDGGVVNPNACMSDLDCGASPGGTVRCINGICQATCTATPEVCNNVDDDCDGLVDEGCMSPDGGSIVCGGFAGLQCPSTMVCVDDPTDTCDPAMAGADCLGVCVQQQSDGGACPAMDPTCNGPLDGGCASNDPTCSPMDGGSLSCNSNADCASGLACVNGVCTGTGPLDAGCSAANPACHQGCSTAMDCAAGQACVNGVCQ